MKTTRVVYFIGILTGFGLFLGSCRPQPALTPIPTPAQPTATLSRLKTMIRSSEHYYNQYNYDYNTSGQLSSYTLRVGESASSPSQTTRFYYDGQGRLTHAERLAAPTFRSSQLRYSYDASNRLIQIQVFEPITNDQQVTLSQTIGLDYNADNEVRQTTVTTGNRVEQTTFTYAHGNVVKTERVGSPAGSVETIFYQHDETPNPLQGIPTSTISAEFFNKNNIRYEGSQLIYTNGQLTSLRVNAGERPELQSLIQFAYEPYQR